MKKNLLILMMALFSAGILSAQDGFYGLYGFTGGAGTDDNTTIILGQAFAFQQADADFEVCAGIGHAQLNKYDEGTVITLTPDQDLTIAGLGTLTHEVAEGRYDLYHNYTSHFNYDSTKAYTVKLLKCEGTVSTDGFDYEVVGLVGHCWTKSNLRAEHYADGTTEIPVALVYNTAPNNNVDANLEDYGRLYTWYSAVGVPENDNTATPEMVDGYVQGICPDGWHIPTATEIADFNTASEVVVKESEYWLTPNAFTNESGFSSRGAGRATILSGDPSYLNLLGWTNYWSVVSNGTEASTIELAYFCDKPQTVDVAKNIAVSVRCVRTDNVGVEPAEEEPVEGEGIGEEPGPDEGGPDIDGE